MAFLLRKFIHANHECTDRSVVRKSFDVRRDFFDKLVQRFQCFLVGFPFCGQEITCAVVEQGPELLQKTMTAVDAVGVPRFALFHRTEEHFIQAERVGSELLYYHIRIDHIEHTLTHFFNGPSANVFSVFQNKFRIVILRPPVTESFDVQHVARYDIDIHMQRRSVVLVFHI